MLDEIQHVQESKHQQKEYYEELLQKEIEEAEQAKSQLKTISQENQDMDQDFENLRALYDQIQQEKETWEDQISFKDKTIDEVLETIETIRSTISDNEL